MISTTWTIVSVVAIIVLGYIWHTYNKLVNLRILVERQASHLEAHLKKKFDLIPALTEVVKGYSNHEKGILTEVTKLRSQWGTASNTTDKMKTANMLESALSKLLIVHERYPNIKADRSFNNIQKNIHYVERELLHERKVFNKRVSYFKQKVEQFPSNIIAKMFRFKEKEFFSMEE
ncbi:MAG: LemA family protein [Candidatus Omnitrophica bacterium]|nr:LemA family protein [Candidatus Omnitrophota bacterium]